MSRLDELFHKLLSGSCTQQEKQELYALLATPDHDADLQRLLDEAIVSDTSGKPVDDGRANEILSIILQAQARPAKRRSLYRILRIPAAAAAVLALAYFGIRELRQPSSTKAVAVSPTAVQDILPAAEGAILTLGDGHSIPLDSQSQGVIARQGGATVKLSGGALAYDNVQTGEATFNTLTTPRGRVFRVTLPDGSGVWLNAASSLRYPTRFDKSDRTVELHGEAYFEITPMANKPFRVKAGGKTEVLVLGTRFNVSAYGNDAQIAATLLQGKVAVNQKVLQPGEQAQVEGTALRVLKADTLQVTAWRNGMFNFENADIREVMNQLERWYDIDVVYENGVPPLRFGGKMERGLSLQQITRILAISDVHCRLEGRKLIITP
ncbi:FecR family protein [Chitinophaga sp.]|uniref:FecR family protein n=1 Tax=Chitinophaga sp. TaxID=1869181 RepID=UPI002629344F|nr:FecR family protein [uncultured Chitinophaga sp.]